MRRYLFIIGGCWMAMAVCAGCKKFTILPPPEDLMTGAKAFADDSAASRSMNGVYTNIMDEAGFFNVNGPKNLTLYADEVIRQTVSELDSGFLKCNLSPRYRPLLLLWRQGYTIIKNCNAVMEGLGRTDKVTASLSRRLTGEARFIRALTYFYLVNMFGDVPLVLSTDYVANAGMPRTNIDAVYDRIMADLKEAAILLPAGFEGNDSLPYRRTRPTRWAADALLARVYLYRGQWADAERMATGVIEAGLFRWPADLLTVFRSTSDETILQFQPQKGNLNTGEATVYLATVAGMPVYEYAPGAVNSFEPGDGRKTAWLKYFSIGNREAYAINKYKVTGAGAPLSEYPVVLRLAEMYLVRAEARARQNDLPGALPDLNAIRTRAQLSPLPSTLSGPDVLLAIAHERQVELFAEWGHRFLDLKRWALLPGTTDPLRVMAEQTLSAKPGWQSWKLLWPIPYEEILVNNLLVQNTGYPSQ